MKWILAGARLAVVAIVLNKASCFALIPGVYNVPPDIAPAKLNAGEVLNVGVGGQVGDLFMAITDALAGSTVNVNGGTIGGFFDADGTVNLFSGTISTGFRMTQNGVLNMTGGTIGFVSYNLGGVWNVGGGTVTGALSLGQQAKLNITGGLVGDILSEGNSVVNLSGGSLAGTVSFNNSTLNMTGGILKTFRFDTGTVWNLSGGTVEGHVEINALNILCRSALVGGASIPGLVPGIPKTITQRNVALSGVLADGSPYSFNMNTMYKDRQDLFPALAPVTVTLVPEPTAFELVGLLIACAGVRCARSRDFLATRCTSAN